MSQRRGADEAPPDPGRDARARRLDTARHVESTRRKLFLAGDFYALLAYAAADGFHAFRDEVASHKVEGRGLPHSLVLGLVRGHARFTEKAVQATRDLLDPEGKARPRSGPSAEVPP